jgi:membrane-bound ClpP family serine protease
MIAGIILLLDGLFLIYLGLILKNIDTKVLEFIAGAISIIIGALMCVRSYSDYVKVKF